MALGLTDRQHGQVGRLIEAAAFIVTPSEDTSKPVQYSPPARVIALSDREYNSTQSESLPVFIYSPRRMVFNVVQVGTNLSGYLALTINGVRYVVECRRVHFDDLKIAGLRVTVFPGLWEFDFGEASRVPSISCEAITPAEDATLCQLFDDVETVSYAGAIIVRREAWVSVSENRNTRPAVVHRPVTDCIPYDTGSASKGAIGLAFWTWDAGFVVSAWQCRTFSHATGLSLSYDQAADPVPIGGA